MEPIANIVGKGENAGYQFLFYECEEIEEV